MKSLLIAILTVLSFNAGAAVSSFTTAAKVKSFTETEVTVESNGKTYKVKRSAVAQKKIKAGDAVMVKLSGDELGLPAQEKPAAQK